MFKLDPTWKQTVEIHYHHHHYYYNYFFVFFTQTAKGQRINRETGELSASGELSTSVELKVDKVEGGCRNPQLLQELRKQLQVLGIHSHSSPARRTEHGPPGPKGELLVKVLPLYIQVLQWEGVRTHSGNNSNTMAGELWFEVSSHLQLKPGDECVEQADALRAPWFLRGFQTVWMWIFRQQEMTVSCLWSFG